jgi:hypothetical protein
VDQFLEKNEDSEADWHLVPIWGPSRTHELFPFYAADIATLQVHQIVTVSSIFETHHSGGIDKIVSPMLIADLQAFPLLCHKIELFAKNFQSMPFRNKYASPRLNLSTLMNLDTNISRRNRLLCKRVLDTEIGVAPAYQTRTQDDIHLRPTMRTFHNVYQLLHLPSLTPKTREKAFKMLNRTVWSGHTTKHTSHV